ncbi:hypothetical protein K439DRAFT_1621252 [Ramaria rubella]|nr:hypothetical protein K439DRAFT_1621252 [Ramaria rubella]
MLYLYEFTGFVSLIALPLSQLLANWVMHITKGMLGAKETWMKLINEMFGLIKLIKFKAFNTKQLAQLFIHKCATAFVDVRDDIKTKIGHLSHHLNFLMTKLDLWHEKFMFITFEHYAEKLSDEATELCVKINKGWKESKRLSSLITLTAMEKYKLEECKCQLSQHCVLHETEGTHHIVIIKLEEMCQNIIKMEEKRSAMVTEVEVQTKCTLQSMMISKSDLENVHDEELKAPISLHCRLAA